MTVKFDYMEMYEFGSGAFTFIGSKKKYPSIVDFLEMLEEKEGFLFNGDLFDVDESWCRYGFYADDFGEPYNGYSYNPMYGGRGAFPVWVVKHEHGEFNREVIR